MTWQRMKDVWQNKAVFGTTDEVGRLFIRCFSCRRIVPAWRVISEKPGGVPGCWCGSKDVRPDTIPTSAAVYWLLFRGLVIRKWILRTKNWDARIPWRQRHA